MPEPGLLATVSGVARSTEAAIADLATRLGLAQVELRRSTRRRRTVSAFHDEGVVVISAPARIGQAELLELAEQLLTKIARDSQRTRVSDVELLARAERLLTCWLPPDFPRPASVRWTSQQSRVWGTCTTADQTIRISERLLGMPDFVVDYVLLHELAHLRHADHGHDFETLLATYPYRDKARGFLEGVSWQSQRGNTGEALAQLDLFADVD